MHQLVALAMQVHALCGDISGQQDAQLRVGQAEVLDVLLLFDVGQAAVQLADRPRSAPVRNDPAAVGRVLPVKPVDELALEEVQGRAALGEDHDAGRLAGPDTHVRQRLQQFLELRIVAGAILETYLASSLSSLFSARRSGLPASFALSSVSSRFATVCARASGDDRNALSSV